MLSRVENGLIYPHIETLANLAQALGTDPAYLLSVAINFAERSKVTSPSKAG